MKQEQKFKFYTGCHALGIDGDQNLIQSSGEGFVIINGVKYADNDGENNVYQDGVGVIYLTPIND